MGEDQKRNEGLEHVCHDAARAYVDVFVSRMSEPPKPGEQPPVVDGVAHRSDFRAAIKVAYRAGREDAAREERAKIAEEIAQAIEWTLTVPVEEARETYARRRATGDEDQAREWAVRLRAWKSARQMAAEAARRGVQPTEEQPDE
jgi:hypothetical protein